LSIDIHSTRENKWTARTVTRNVARVQMQSVHEADVVKNKVQVATLFGPKKYTVL
jgi:hypothetical protein